MGGGMILKSYLIVMVMEGVLLFGCSKHNSSARSQAPAAPELQKSSASTKSDDAFKKYYTDVNDTVKLRAKSALTFSMRTSEATPPVLAGTNSPLVSEKGNFDVQIASTPSNGEAELIASKFKKMGYPTYIVEVQNPRSDLGGTYYRVRIGSFATAADGRTFGETVVRPEHLDYWVVRKSN